MPEAVKTERLYLRLAIALAALLTSLPAGAQDNVPTQAELAAADAARKAKAAGRYLDAAEALRPLAFDAAGRPKPGVSYDEWADYQTRMTTERPRPAARSSPLDPGEAARLRAATPHDAIREIVARARLTRVVVLNEDHGQPRGRAFGLEVARALRPLGYRVLAVETLNTSPDPAENAAMAGALVHDGYVRQMSGFYVADPVFGDFLRQALAIGYRPLAYETTDFSPSADRAEQITWRDQAQAAHLAAALKADPAAKVFVYVGYHHVAEAPLRDGAGPPTRWMASRLKAMTGLDPLTIDQVTLAEDPSADRSDGYGLVADRAATRSIALFEGATPLVVGEYAGAVDLQIVHPRTRHVAGRPDWLLAMSRKPVPVPQRLLPAAGTRLIQAFVAGEADNAIPVDQVLVTAGRPAPALMLPAAPVRLAVQDPPPAPAP